MLPLHLIKITFEEPVLPKELPWFRGAIIGLAENHPLFHNHQDQGYHYTYPKIQYKIIDDSPAILGIDEGAEELQHIFNDRDSINCRIGNHYRELNIQTIVEWNDEVGITEVENTYFINNWLPLNGRNYNAYLQADGMLERIAMLERILTGNILSFAKGLDLYFDTQVNCAIDDMQCVGTKNYKGVELMSFFGSFKTNVKLPDWIGLGKSASLNHGIIIQI